MHSWKLTEDTDGYIIFLTPAFYLEELPQKKLNSFPFFGTLLKPLVTLLNTDQKWLHNIIQLMQQEHLGEQQMKDDVTRGYQNILLMLLKRIYQKQSTGTQVPAPYYLSCRHSTT